MVFGHWYREYESRLAIWPARGRKATMTGVVNTSACPAGGVAGRGARCLTRAARAHPDALGWATTLPLAGLAACRLANYEGMPLLAVANAATHFAYLPAWVSLVAAAARRRKALAVTAGAVAAAHLAWVLPEVGGGRRRLPVAGGAPRLRVMCANLRFTALDWTGSAREIVEQDADVVLLQELTPAVLAVLRREGAFAGYDHEVVDARPTSFGGGIWSRHPIRDAEVRNVAGLPMLTGVVDVGGEGVRLWNVHTRSPLIGGLRRWHDQLSYLAKEAAASIDAGTPVVMAGDFNATCGNRDFRGILARGMRDAHVVAGRGLATTWSAWSALAPLFRIDHVVVSDRFAVLGVSEGRAHQSDHKPVVADLALLGA